MLPHESINKKPMPKPLLVLIIFSLILMVAKIIAATSGGDGDYIYIDCVSVDFIDSATLPKNYATKVISKSDDERALLESVHGVFNVIQPRTQFHFIETDIKSYTVKSGNCKS